MDNKYYKPDLDEFYIGFEFQNKLGDEWETEIFKDTNNLHSMYLNRNTIHLRVKYLDKEDIESLGFKFNQTIGNEDLFKLENSFIYINSITNNIEIYKENGC